MNRSKTYSYNSKKDTTLLLNQEKVKLEKVTEIKKETKRRVKRVKEEIQDVKDSVKEVADQAGDVIDAAKGSKRKGRKPVTKKKSTKK